MSHKIPTLKIILGPMFSGKSTELIRYCNRCEVINVPYMLINHAIDKRYTKEGISTHDSVSKKCIFTHKLMELIDTDKFRESKFIIIEEAQFFPDLYNFVVECLDTYKKSVIVAGLDGDYKKREFGQILKIIPHADFVVKLHALCKYCNDGTPAIFTSRISKSTQQVDVGSADKYEATCRKHFNLLMNNK